MVMQKRIEKIEEEKRETQTKESRPHKEEPVLFEYRGENWFGTGDEDPPF